MKLSENIRKSTNEGNPVPLPVLLQWVKLAVPEDLPREEGLIRYWVYHHSKGLLSEHLQKEVATLCALSHASCEGEIEPVVVLGVVGEVPTHRDAGWAHVCDLFLT